MIKQIETKDHTLDTKQIRIWPYPVTTDAALKWALDEYRLSWDSDEESCATITHISRDGLTNAFYVIAQYEGNVQHYTFWMYNDR